jgi:uncharacterized protein YjbI with pentapeptide repeats
VTTSAYWRRIAEQYGVNGKKGLNVPASKFESGGSFEAETFKKVNLNQQVVRDATFSVCKFVRCDFSETVFQNCRFIECQFDDCTMRLAKVKGTTFSRVKFTGCNLLGIDWTEADWSEWMSKISAVEFESCVLEYSIFLGLQLKKLKVKDCNAREVNFSETDLSEADFSGTDLAGAVFLRTNLTKTNFVGAKNYALNVMDNKAKGARFSLPEAVRLLYSLNIVIVDPATNEEISGDDLNNPV